MIVQRELRRRAWFQVDAPAAADVLIVCGEPGVGLAEAVDAVWAEVPGPRARVRLPPRASEVAAVEAMDRAVAELADIAAQREDARSRIAAGPWEPSEGSHGDSEHGSHELGHDDDEHGGHDSHTVADDGSGEGDHGGHGGHEHHMMGAPGGLAMAERAPDRDGLKLDVLHVPLGPVLPDWPAGLRLMLTLQGDVVQSAEVHVLDGAGGGRFWDEPWLAAPERVTQGEAERRRAAAHLDSVARFLGVAGWRGQAERALWLRDAVLAGRPGNELAPRFTRFARRTGRSWSLRWMTRGIGVIDEDTVRRYGLTGPAARHLGDVPARLAGWLAEIGGAMTRLDDSSALNDDEGPRGPVRAESSSALLAALPSLLDGAELAAARLIVASLDPDLDQVMAVNAANG
ncbi:hypothetical protein [Actinomadura sp. SCN-SB]|uniref:hypothetical protein n=1 Tax=Actinomadura sp. SCN-SB TaxID=3373092 RepID=UPI00375108AC